jgi:hypothetical protein
MAAAPTVAVNCSECSIDVCCRTMAMAAILHILPHHAMRAADAASASRAEAPQLRTWQIVHGSYCNIENQLLRCSPMKLPRQIVVHLASHTAMNAGRKYTPQWFFAPSPLFLWATSAGHYRRSANSWPNLPTTMYWHKVLQQCVGASTCN